MDAQNEISLQSGQVSLSENEWHAKKELLKNTVAKELSDEEFELFLHICKHKNLDPIQKQIYAIKRGGAMTIQIGIDGFRLIAERSGRYAPGQDTEFLFDGENRLMGAKVYVKKQTLDCTWHQVSATAFLYEYSTGRNLWVSMPSVMIEKVAECRALRRAFPGELSGLYSSEEMNQAEPVIVEEAPKIAKESSQISFEEWKKLNDYLNGSQDIRENLMKLCKVSDLRKISKSQLETCRNYVRIKREKSIEAVED